MTKTEIQLSFILSCALSAFLVLSSFCATALFSTSFSGVSRNIFLVENSFLKRRKKMEDKACLSWLSCFTVSFEADHGAAS